jgi:hypothetical protein
MDPFRLNRARMRLLLALIFALLPANAQQFPEHFTNLQVMPKDISKRELMSTMRSFAFALDVRCEYCHAQKDKEFDYSSDEKQPKKTARVMLQMVGTINRDFIGKVNNPKSIQVECVTCHHGLAQPRPLKAVLIDELDKQGIEGTIQLYRDLRSRYYGTGQYDFGETTLNLFTEFLLAKNMNKEAVAIMEMNFSANNPQSVWAYHMLAMAHESNGEIDRAQADYRKVIEVHPDDIWAQKQLDLLSHRK